MSVAALAGVALGDMLRWEEEEMTSYTPQDVTEHWEFKILRSATTQFRDPVRLRGILAEEARGGWTMIEKFDDPRVRLKRPASARATDATLGLDPYRTWVGISSNRLALWIGLAVFGGSLALALLVFLAVGAVTR